LSIQSSILYNSFVCHSRAALVALEAAEKEINEWLEWRKVMPSQIEDYDSSIKTLVEAIQYGALTLKDNCFTQKLLFPIGEGEAVKELTYKPRINGVMLAPCLTGVKASDGDARVVAYLQCLTGEAKQILKSLDPADSRIANSIVVFFLG